MVCIISNRSKLKLEGLNANVLISGLVCQHDPNYHLLTKWDSYRTADWAELVVDPETTLQQSQQLLNIAS